MQEKEQRFRLGEFWLAPRADGASDAWHITWYDKRRRQTRQRSTRTSDFEQAKIVLAEHYVNRGKRVAEAPTSVVLEHVLTRYFEQHAKKLPSAHFSDYAIERWRAFWQADTVSQVTDERLTEFATYLAKGARKPLKATTINRVLGVGQAALERALTLKEITEIPNISSVPEPGRQILYRASLPELARWFNASGTMPHVRMWGVATLATLARPQTVLEYSRPQFHFDLRRIDLLAPWRQPTLKGRPVVPMIDMVVSWLEECRTGLLIVYKSRRGTRPLKSIRMGFERARDRAGLLPQMTPYTLRRTLSTELRRRGVNPWEIAGFLGHQVNQFEITERYAIYSPDYLGVAASTLMAICWELQPMLDFELLRTSCVPEPGAERSQKAVGIGNEFSDLGRLGLEPRTNTLKADLVCEDFKHLASQKPSHADTKIRELAPAAYQLRTSRQRRGGGNST